MKDYFLFVKQQWAVLCFGFLCVFWGNFGQSFFVSWFGASIQTSLGISASHYGFAYSLATLGSAVTVIWAGGLIDRYPLHQFVIGVSLGLALACAILSQANSILLLVVGFYCLRLFGQALYPHAGTTTLARLFTAHRGKALSISASGFPVGEIILPLIAVASIAALGWQQTFLSIGLFIVCLGLPLMLWLLNYSGLNHTVVNNGGLNQRLATQPLVNQAVPASKQPASTANKIQGGRSALLGDYRYWLALPGLVAGPFIATGIFIQQNFVIASKGWTPEWLATCFIVFGAAHWTSSLTTGVLVDRFKAVQLLPYFSLPMLVALLVAALLPGDWVAVAMMALLGVTIGGAPPITGSLWPDIYGTQHLGAIRSVNVALMVFATAVAPVLFGWLIDQGVELKMLFGGCALYVAVGCVLLALSYTYNPKPHAISVGL